MAAKIIIDEQVKNYFTTDKRQHLVDYCQQKLPIYVKQRSSKIKPVRSNIDHLYELKVRVGKQFFRLAYFNKDTVIQVSYITDTLQKIKFDREVTLFLNKVK